MHNWGWLVLGGQTLAKATPVSLLLRLNLSAHMTPWGCSGGCTAEFGGSRGGAGGAMKVSVKPMQ